MVVSHCGVCCPPAPATLITTAVCRPGLHFFPHHITLLFCCRGEQFDQWQRPISQTYRLIITVVARFFVGNVLFCCRLFRLDSPPQPIERRGHILSEYGAWHRSAMPHHFKQL